MLKNSHIIRLFHAKCSLPENKYNHIKMVENM
jgi:hypothetical protein